MNPRLEKNESLIAILIVMATFVIFAGWADGRLVGAFYSRVFQTEVTLAETITVSEYELIYPAMKTDDALNGDPTEPDDRNIEEEYIKIPKVEIPAGATARVFIPFDFYNLRNPDRVTISKPASRTISASFRTSDEKSVHVTFTDDNELLQSPHNYVDIRKLESYSDVIAAYDETINDWTDHWNRSQRAGVIVGIVLASLIAFGFYLIKKGSENVTNTTLFGFSIAIIIVSILDLLFVMAYVFPHLR